MSGGWIWDRSQSSSYNAAVAPLAADDYLPYARPSALFLQSARHDQFVPAEDAVRDQQLASSPKQVRLYDANHMLNAQARSDRQAWLAVRLGFSQPGGVLPRSFPKAPAACR